MISYLLLSVGRVCPPVGYVEPERQERKTEKQQEEVTMFTVHSFIDW